MKHHMKENAWTQQIILLVLKRTVVRAQETFGPKERASELINDTINKLEGDLLWV